VLYTNATIITVNKSGEIILNGAILVEGSKIADIGKTDALKTKYPHEEIVGLWEDHHLGIDQHAYAHCADFVARSVRARINPSDTKRPSFLTWSFHMNYGMLMQVESRRGRPSRARRLAVRTYLDAAGEFHS
jgi:hypothetical protein